VTSGDCFTVIKTVPIHFAQHKQEKITVPTPTTHSNIVRREEQHSKKAGTLFGAKNFEAAASVATTFEECRAVDSICVKDVIFNLYHAYSRALDEKPLVTKSATAGVISLIGNILGQYVISCLSGCIFTIDIAQLTAFTISGAIFVGPYIHSWYEQLWKVGTWLDRKKGASKTTQTLAQVSIDQTIGVSIFLPLYFFVYEFIEAMVSMRTPRFTATAMKIKSDLLSIILVNWKVWPFTNFLSFSYVPKNLRVLFANIVSVFWNAYLCTRIVTV